MTVVRVAPIAVCLLDGWARPRFAPVARAPCCHLGVETADGTRKPMLRGYPPTANNAGEAAVDRQQHHLKAVGRFTQHVAPLVYPDTSLGVPSWTFRCNVYYTWGRVKRTEVWDRGCIRPRPQA